MINWLLSKLLVGFVEFLNVDEKLTSIQWLETVFRFRVNSRRHMRREFIDQSNVLWTVYVFLIWPIKLHKHVDTFVSRYWEPTYEDSLNLIARVPVVAAYVYRRSVRIWFLIYVAFWTGSVFFFFGKYILDWI